MAPPELASHTLGMTFEHVLDHESDVPADESRPHYEQYAADRAHRSDERERGRHVGGVRYRPEHYGSGEPPEDEAVDPEHGEADRAHLRGCGRREGLEDRDGKWGDRRVRQELQQHDEPEGMDVERDREQTAVHHDRGAG